MRVVLLGLGVATLGAGGVLSSQQAGQKVEYGRDVRPTVQKFCAPCHTGKDAAAGIDLSRAKTDLDVQTADRDWDRVVRALSSNHMPPASATQPSLEQRQRLIAAVESILSGNCALQDPGRVTVRRLNRTEYTNTIRDLTGVEFDPAADFPNDDVGYGFDNIGDVLTISPLLMEKYLDAAEKVAEAAISVGGSKSARYNGDRLSQVQGTNTTNEGDHGFFAGAVSTLDHTFSVGGDYRIRVMAYGMQAGPEPCRMAILLDGKALQTFDVPATASKPEWCEVPIAASAGRHTVGVAFTNDYYQPNNPDPKQRDRNLYIRQLEIEGPFGGQAVYPETTTRIIPQQPAPGSERQAAQTYLAAFAAKAYRRPLKPGELDAIMRVFEVPLANKEPFNRCMQVAVAGILVSPNFLFRVELDPKGIDKSGSRLIGSYEIASRLSYFLWSTMPDAELFALAAKGTLNEPQAIEAQVERMLKDPKAKMLGRTFADQWLQLTKLTHLRPDPKSFAIYSPQARNLMVRQATMFFDDIVANDRSVIDFLDSDYTFVNNQLAAYYDIGGVDGAEMRRVAIDKPERGGLLGMGAVLMLTSNPTRTSPTKRGKWILEQILGTPPPPPPPMAGDLQPTAPDGRKLNLREQLEEHRKNPECAGCHAQMDPLGFSLENFNAVGQWRFNDAEGKPVDASGVMPDGKKVNGPIELRKVLLDRKDQFVRALSEKLMIFGLGRGVTLRDDCALDDVAKRCRESGYRFSAIIKGIATSDAFRKRRAQGDDR